MFEFSGNLQSFVLNSGSTDSCRPTYWHYSIKLCLYSVQHAHCHFTGDLNMWLSQLFHLKFLLLSLTPYGGLNNLLMIFRDVSHSNERDSAEICSFDSWGRSWRLISWRVSEVRKWHTSLLLVHFLSDFSQAVRSTHRCCAGTLKS